MCSKSIFVYFFFFFQAEDGIRDHCVTGVQTCALPIFSRTHLEGHAVRAMYACCGATDYYLETGDQAYWKTLNTLRDDLVNHQMRSEEHTSELQSHSDLVCRLLLEKKKKKKNTK